MKLKTLLFASLIAISLMIFVASAIPDNTNTTEDQAYISMEDKIIRDTFEVSKMLPEESKTKDNDAKKILLINSEIDTTDNTGTFSASTTEAEDTETGNYYIVQFKGRIADSWKQSLEDTGAEIIGYVPNNAYLVKMGPDVRNEVGAIDEVQWIGDYRPEYKISSGLLESTENVEEIIVVLFNSENNAKVSADIEALGGEIIKSSGDIIQVVVNPTIIADIAALDEIKWIEKYVQPVVFNDVARDITGVSYVTDTYGLTGSGQIIGISDTGLDTGVNDDTMHEDLRRENLIMIDLVGDGAGDEAGHGTHVAGSVLGNGNASGGLYKGMAPEAGLVFQAFSETSGGYLIGVPSDLEQLFQQAYDEGARIHTNSWGSADNGAYDSMSYSTDKFMWEHPDMLILFAAGNAGRDGNSDGIIDPDSIGSPATAKNCLTVGASENYRGANFNVSTYVTYGSKLPQYYPEIPIKDDYMADDPEGIAAFSSRGPTDDGRLKPDIVAPGTFIISTRSSIATGTGWGEVDENYLYMGGTSMATPITAGAAALVRQNYVDNLNVSNPSAALIKATIINGAHDMTPGQYGTNITQEIEGRPDRSQGWGRLDLNGSIYPSGERKIRFCDELEIGTGESFERTYYINNSSEPLRVTLVWTDYPAEPYAASTLVNDLDLYVIGPEGRAYKEIDGINNVEQIEIDQPEEGLYTVIVSGFNVPQGPQPFALVISATFSDDTTAPASISGLNGIPGETWINWNWTNPKDTDFDHVELYLNGIFQNETNSTSYNTTGLIANTTYEISTRTVDNKNNINTSWVNHTVSTTADTTAPASITSLGGTPGETWINWSWTNPTDPDFDHVELYLDGSILPTTNSTSYNTTGLVANTTYEFSTRSVDNAGNINSSRVNLTVSTTADTTAPAGITGLSGTPGETWINWSWTNPTDPDFDHVELYLNGIFQNETNSTYYNTTNLSDGTVYELSTRTVDIIGNTNSNYVNLTVSTSSPKSDEKSSDRSTSSGSSGGGSGSTGEAFENIVFKDVKTENIVGGHGISYSFDDQQNAIQYINFSALRNSRMVSVTIEILKERSAMVDKNAPGIVYSNLNIWVGKSGFATADNIAEPIIGFSVTKEWLTENGIDENSIRLYRYSEGKWNTLDTDRIGEDASYLYFEAKTPGFSPFAITGNKKEESDLQSTSITDHAIGSEQNVDQKNAEENKSQSAKSKSIPGLKSGHAVMLFTLSSLIARRRR